jgi:hypothetical protein
VIRMVEGSSAPGGTAGPGVYIVLGAVALVLGTLLATDYRGWGTKYILLGFRRTAVISPGRARFIRRHRVRYGIGAVVGLFMLVFGLLSL